MSAALDRRLYAFRDDLADVRLKGRVDAARFVEGAPVQVRAPVARVHRAPAADAMQLTQAVMGATALRFDDAEGWSWLQFDDDGYVGYVRSEDLSAIPVAATHGVVVPSTFIFPAADLKSQPAIAIPRGSRLCVSGTAGDYLAMATGGFVFASHVAALPFAADDFVRVAESFLHTPYLWGGTTAQGIDCSGLVQASLTACGTACPRDTDMQEQALGTGLMVNDLDGLTRGDLVFWKGHVGLMLDDTRLLHANGHHMMTVIEPLADAVARIAAKGTPVSSVRRLS